MKVRYVFGGIALVVLLAAVWALFGPGEDKETAFARFLRNSPSSVVVREYWAAQGIGGDGFNVLTFSIAQGDFLSWMKSLGYRSMRLDENGDRLLLAVEIEKVEQRTRQSFPLNSPYAYYLRYEDGRRKHVLFDTNSPANAVFWSVPGPPLD